MLSTRSIWSRSDKENVYLLESRLMDSIRNEVSGLRAWDTVNEISKYHRIRGGGEGSDYNKCVEWLAEELRKIGYSEVSIKRFKADGRKKYYNWTSLVGWRVKEAELWLMEPEKKIINRFSEQPTCLMTYSQGGEVESEVVFVGQGKTDEDYENKNVEGKLVFAVGGDAASVYRQAVLQRGAAGVIVGPSDREDRNPYTDLIEVGRISPTGDEVVKTRFGFSVSRNQQNELRPLFDAGKKVVMKAWVDAEVVEGDMPVIEVRMVGRKHPNQEIVVMGHLDHYKQGANDNASGCAGMVEMIRNMITLVDRGDLPPLKRTLRFLFVPEIHGTTAYLSEHEDLKEKGIVGINLDMIGEDLALCQASFNLTTSPYSVPGYIDDVFINLLPWLKEDEFFSPRGKRHSFNYDVKQYSGGSDHVMFNDSTFSIPSVMLGHSDIFHHTNLDTPEKCDPTEMKRIISLAEAACIFLANAEDPDALRLAEEVYLRARIRMSERTLKSLRIIRKAVESGKASYQNELYNNVIEYPLIQCRVESDNLKKVMELCEQEDSRKIIEELAKGLHRHASHEQETIKMGYKRLLLQYNLHDETYTPADAYIKASITKPKRLLKGPLINDYDRRRLIWEEIKENLGEERAKWYDEHKEEAGENLSSKVFEILNLMNGERTLLDIRNTVSCEFGETDISYILNFAIDLEKLGFIILV